MKTVINSILSLLLFAVAATATVGDANESDAKQFSQPVKVSPVMVKAEEPVLPRKLLKPGESAEIIIRCAIDEKGELVNVRTITTTHKELEKVVMKSLENWEFRAAMLNGKPLKSRVDIPFKFVLARN